MSVIEAVTVTLFRVKDAPVGWRRKRRTRKTIAYRDAAWAKMRSRCECAPYDEETGAAPEHCKYHDREYRAVSGYPENPPEFRAPAVWGLPPSRSSAWDYGRAVAFRLARFYAYLDSKPSGSGPDHGET